MKGCTAEKITRSNLSLKTFCEESDSHVNLELLWPYSKEKKGGNPQRKKTFTWKYSKLYTYNIWTATVKRAAQNKCQINMKRVFFFTYKHTLRTNPITGTSGIDPVSTQLPSLPYYHNWITAPICVAVCLKACCQHTQLRTFVSRPIKERSLHLDHLLTHFSIFSPKSTFLVCFYQYSKTAYDKWD